MADDQVTLSFNNDVFTIAANSDAGQQANYTGSVSVDYTTGTYSGLNFKVQGFGENSGFGDSGGAYGGTLGVNGNNYAVTGGGFTLSWTGMTPSAARAVLVANNNDTYDTQANPASQRSQPVSSTVNSSSNDTAVCFAQGTRIATMRGEIAVESLVVGDIAITASGERRPIRWVSHRRFDCRRHLRPDEVMPIRISAGALGPSRPLRDLVVSPGHALAFDVCGEVLVPAIALVNGSTLVQEDAAGITYWHVELDSHDLLLAEGVPAESYLDMGNRSFFADAMVVDLVASPDAAVRSHADFCRPFHGVGPVVETIRARLQGRAESLRTSRGDRLMDQPKRRIAGR